MTGHAAVALPVEGEARAELGVEVEVEAETTEKTALDPPWNVIVHDDPVTLMSFVTMVLQKVFGYGRAKAHRLMMEVHTTGRSVVWTGGKERAEMYIARLHAHQLLCTLERATP